MGRKVGEDGVTVDVGKELREQFWTTVPDGFKKKQVMAAAMKLWIGLQPQARGDILINPDIILQVAEFCSGHIVGRKASHLRNRQNKGAKSS